ncbi:hypothetical protein IFM89_026141 [Coptis chinensis]|uniref:endo-polygalacturonase n=1 Tax=Coptis chinensis TaxID=261450 RepID=A0A835IDR8_9MAGN|nr:hypothetical protein IFM89_026141 [Coptis chinensis]
MGILALILVTLSCSNVIVLSRSFVKEINVLNYGAVGDGYTDDSQAFLKAWDVTCNLEFAESANMIIPGERRFLVNPITFNGPCKLSRINVQILGTILSPQDTETWDGIDSSQWLAFRRVTGLIVDGYGTIDGRGTNWWSNSCRNSHSKDCTKMAPTAIKFIFCSNSYIKDLHFIDSANTHIGIRQSEWFHITNLKISAPETSPNTDGIHIDRSKHVFIDRSSIRSGDDCISIGDHTSDIRITNINCGPGHGISVGSLGKGGSYVQVENIRVSHVNFYQTTNGVRIKTWKGATGYARDITFEHLNFTAVQNPIVIDQYYCNKLYLGNCNSAERSATGVHISDVTYKNATGTSSTSVAIRLNCSQSTACTGILLDTIQLSLTSGRHTTHKHWHERVTSSCTNARGKTKGLIQPNIPCLLQN